MKTLNRKIYFFILTMVMASALFISCEDDAVENNGGEPIIYYVRLTAPESRDSLVVSAFLGNTIAVMGDNLSQVKELWFNDKQAVLTPTFITDQTIIVGVPNAAPVDVTDKMKLIFRNGQEYTYDFRVSIPPPVVQSMDLEYVPDGETAHINGQYFFDVTPMVVEFTAEGGGFIEAELLSYTETRLNVVVPEGAGTGPLRVTTNFGASESVLHFRDERNIILNYDEAGKTPAGSWRTGIFEEGEHSLDGRYVKFEGIYTSPERTEGDGSPYESQFWGQASGRPDVNMLPGEPSDYDMKFEAKVFGWDKSYLNICFAPWNHTGNQEIWSNALNARAIWGPWAAKNVPFDTDDQWVTVTIPMTEFRWAMGTTDAGVTYTDLKFNKAVTGSLSFWVLSAPGAAATPFHFLIDNVRIVPNREL